MNMVKRYRNEVIKIPANPEPSALSKCQYNFIKSASGFTASSMYLWKEK